MDKILTRRRLLRFVAYTFLCVLAVLLLVLYSVYLSAQRPPAFYRESLAASPEMQEMRNKEMLRKARHLNNDLQNTEKPWKAGFSTEELNAYLAVEAAKQGANLLPAEIVEPRIALSGRTAEVACRIEHGPVAGILNLSLGLSLPEPNRLTLRLKQARLGRLPISKELPLKILREALRKQGFEVVSGTEGGDPTLTLSLALHYGKGKAISLESFEIVEGGIEFSGTTSNAPRRGRSVHTGPER